MNMKKILINIITSEKTWQNLSKYGFDEKLKKERGKFDFSVVHNGYCDEAIEFYNSFEPEYFFLRPNLGYDPAAVQHLIKLVPVYETTLILHDDHWFEDKDWLDKINKLRNERSETDVWGNLLNSLPPPDIEIFYRQNKIELSSECKPGSFLHGIAGIYSDKAISNLKSFSFNFPSTADKHLADLGERTFSGILQHLNLKYDQLEPGIFKFLKHSSSSERDYLFWTANKYAAQREFEKAREYLFEYIEMCKTENFQRDILVAYYNVAQMSYLLNDYKACLKYSEKCLSIIPDFAPALDLINNLKPIEK